MREKTYYNFEPKEVEVQNIGGKNTIVFLRENITKEPQKGDLDNVYSADEYVINRRFDPNLEQRILSDKKSWFDVAKKRDYEETAKKVRSKRNEMLAESDKEMCLDRLGVAQPSGSAFSDWLAFLQRISSVMFGEMARYRQELRDITKQQGFPYDVKFPEKPETK